jgi:hypothetical protein
MSLKESMNISDISIQDIKKEMALQEALPVFLTWKAFMDTLVAGTDTTREKIDLTLTEPGYVPVIVGANVIIIRDSPLTLGLGAAGALEVGLNIKLWDDEPMATANALIDHQVDAMVDDCSIEFADEDCDRCFCQWILEAVEVYSAANVPSAVHRQVPDTRPIIIPPFIIKDGSFWVSVEILKDAATTHDLEFGGTVILWVKWVKQSDAQLMKMLMQENENS